MKHRHSSKYEVTIESDENYPCSDQYAAGGHYLRETWWRDGVIERQHGPAVTIRHPLTHMAIREEYYKDGVLHRYGRPAVIELDAQTGEVLRSRYYENGREVMPPDHSPNGP